MTVDAVAIVGAGRLGSALARRLHAAGYPIVALATSSEPAQLLADEVSARLFTSPAAAAGAAAWVFMTVPDDRIDEVAAQIPWSTGQTALHCSGALTLAPLAPARAAGARIGSLHPLQTFPTRTERPERFDGITWAIDGADDVRADLALLVERLAGRPLVVPAAERAAYHAGAVLACNDLVALTKLASDLWAGFADRATTLAALAPLLRATVANLEQRGLPGALTGPVARGDAGTVVAQLDAIASRSPAAAEAYRLLGGAALELAEEQGLEPARAARLRDALTTSPPAGSVCRYARSGEPSRTTSGVEGGNERR